MGISSERDRASIKRKREHRAARGRYIQGVERQPDQEGHRREIPLLFYLAGAVAAGILLSAQLHLPPYPLYAGGGLVLAAYCYRGSGGGRVVVLLLLLFLLLGAARQSQLVALESRLDSWDGQTMRVTGTLLERIPSGQTSWSAPLRLRGVEQGGSAQSLEETVLLRGYFPLDQALGAGASLSVRGRVKEISGPANFGAYDYRAHLQRQGINRALQVADYDDANLVPGSASLLIRPVQELRAALELSLGEGLPPEKASLLQGLLFGERGIQSPEIETSFRRSGVLHLLAVSGLHVGFLAGAALLLGRWMGLLPRQAAWGALVAVALYIAMVGTRASIVRAGFMAGVGFAGLVWGRRTESLAALGGAALFLLLWRPWLLFTPGFQLSFAATWGILYLTPWLEQLLLFLPRKLGLPLAVSLAAQLATWPLAAYHFLGVPLLAPVTNLLAVPLAAALVMTGLLGAALCLVIPLPGTWILWPARVLAGGLIGWTELMSSIPMAYLRMAPPSLLFLALYYLLLFAAAGNSKGNRPEGCVPGQGWARLVTVAVLCVVLLWAPFDAGPGGTEITFVAVGMGDAAVIRTADQTFLVDAGPGPDERGYDPGERVLAPYLIREGVRQIDIAIITHPHYDHYGGLEGLHREVPVRALLLPPEFERQAFGPLGESGIPVFRARAGDVLELSSEVVLEFLHPELPLLEGTRCDANNNSLVFLLRSDSATVLFTGDLEEEGEGELLAQQKVPRATVLKVGHHGSNTSTGAEFLGQVQPALAVIPVGPNPWGHPRDEVLQRLDDGDCRILRTDLDGAVRISIRGSDLEVETARSRTGEPAAR